MPAPGWAEAVFFNIWAQSEKVGLLIEQLLRATKTVILSERSGFHAFIFPNPTTVNVFMGRTGIWSPVLDPGSCP